MYKKKLFAFGFMTLTIVVIALLSAMVSASLTRTNLEQSGIAQSLLAEHQRLSSASYRLFKQFTDEYTFGSSANQADVRNKKTIIKNSVETIRKLKLRQQKAIGVEEAQSVTQHIDRLDTIIAEIITEFQELLAEPLTTNVAKQERLHYLLEVKIDNLFREAMDSSVARQSRNVATLDARIRTLNTSMLWFVSGLGLVSLLIILYGCYWLFGHLYNPLMLIKGATDRIADGDFDRPITETLDEEFEDLVASINSMAVRLKEHEAKKEESRKKLEYEVKQRTADLTEANLQLTQQDAHRRQFINDISHELRTPLTIIRGESQIALRMESASEEDYRETLSSVLNQSVSLSRLVDDMLLLARAETNKLHLELESVRLYDILKTELNKWNKLLKNDIVQLACDEDFKRVEILLDKHRIHQLLSILLDNAVKYSPAGKNILIDTNTNRDGVSISVIDHGSGVSAAEIEHIFERFVRFRKSTEGVGLGLPIARMIAKAHDGEIAVQSTPGQGSTFTFTLPYSINDKEANID